MPRTMTARLTEILELLQKFSLYAIDEKDETSLRELNEIVIRLRAAIIAADEK